MKHIKQLVWMENIGRARSEPGGTRRRTGGEVKGETGEWSG